MGLLSEIDEDVLRDVPPPQQTCAYPPCHGDKVAIADLLFERLCD